MAKHRQPHGPSMMLGNMRRFALAFAIGLAPCAQAGADTVILACSGKIRNLTQGEKAVEIPRMFSLIVDTTKMTLVVDDYDQMPLTASRGTDRNFLSFGLGALPKDDGPIAVRLNRITGEMHLGINVGGEPMGFDGICKSAQKLF